jgi:hypothetical protein
MSDSRKHLLDATAAIVAARIAARAHDRPGGDLHEAPDAPSLKDEFISTYHELEQAFEAIAAANPPKPYVEKHKRHDYISLLGD